MIFSASNIVAFETYGDSFYYLKRHLVAVIVGIIALFFLSRFDYHRLSKTKTSLALLGFMFILLLLVLVPGVGKVAGGSSRWISLGVFNLQPSEFAKIAILLWAASVLSQKTKDVTQLGDLVVPLIPVTAGAALLVVLQPDLGTTISICFTVFVLIYLSGAKSRHIVGIGSVGLLITVGFILSEGYRRTRMLAFLDPRSDPLGKGFHLIQSLLAFGSGGIYGVGPGVSRQKFFYLPAAHTDFILAIIGEELGLLGTLSIVLLFLTIAYAGIKIAVNAEDSFGRLLSAGITTLIVIQALINMGAVTGLLPITGIPLPLTSYGSSSLVFTLCGVGVLLNIASQGRRKAERATNESNNLRRGNSRPRISRVSSSQGARTAQGKN